MLHRRRLLARGSLGLFALSWDKIGSPTLLKESRPNRQGGPPPL